MVLDWEKREMTKEIRVTQYTVSDIMALFNQDKLFVNRRYQRKLIWLESEKKLLIDSMLQDIPLPAIFLVESDVPYFDSNEVKNAYEIIDGLQRLNAIVAFMLGEFPIEFDGFKGYYDPMANSETFIRLQDGKLQPKSPLLPRDFCQKFARKQLSAIIAGKDEETVNLIFSRINDTGHKVSSQDLRQAKSIGPFPDLVRHIASDVRMDNTFTDHISLAEMPQISIGPKSKGYGVNIDDVFWRRHDLINSHDIRESSDEQLIEDLAATLLLGEQYTRSKRSLDQLYDSNTMYGRKIIEAIDALGTQTIEQRFKETFDTFDTIFASVNSDFSDYIFNGLRKVKNKDECFRIVFTALYHLIEAGYTLDLANANIVADCLKKNANLFDEIILKDQVDFKHCMLVSEQLQQILRQHFTRQSTLVENVLVSEITKRLCYSSIESQMTEFKIGISDFGTGRLNPEVIHKIAKTLVAMSNNTNAREHGLLVLGIADNREQYDAWKACYSQSAEVVNQHYVPGVTAEAKCMRGSFDNYYHFFLNELAKEPISGKLKEYVVDTCQQLLFHGHDLIVLDAAYQGEISYYNDEKYVRQGNSTIKVSNGAESTPSPMTF